MTGVDLATNIRRNATCLLLSRRGREELLGLSQVSIASAVSAGGKRSIYQSKSVVYILSREIAAFAVDIQETILGSRIQHRFTYGGIVRIGDVDDG